MSMDYSAITKQLYIGTTPNRFDYAVLRDLGVRLVINMRFLRGRTPPAGIPPMRYMRFRTIDNPLFPIPMEVLLQGYAAWVKLPPGDRPRCGSHGQPSPSPGPAACRDFAHGFHS